MSDTSSRIERRRRFNLSPESPEISPPPGEPVVEPAPVPAGDPPSVTSLSDGGDSSWKEIDDFARSGTRVFVRSFDGEEAEALLHQTRRYNPRDIKWERIERWMRVDGTGTLNWKPVHYRTIT